jgi:hypothetical protein
MQVKVWFANKREHVQQLLLRKPFAGAAEIERPRGTVQALQAYVPTERRDGWMPSELPFEQSLPADLEDELSDDYQYPLRAEGEDRDRFFSYCLGHTDERPELTIAENELSYRVSCHVDDACESGRARQARRISSLVRCLRRLKQEQEQAPSQIGRLKGGHQFGTLPGTPVNLISKSEHARDAALVVYADHESDMKATAERLIGQVHYFMQDKVVVLAARDFSDDIVHYPVLNDNVTAPERRAQTTDYSQGGLTIEPSFD